MLMLKLTVLLRIVVRMGLSWLYCIKSRANGIRSSPLDVSNFHTPFQPITQLLRLLQLPAFFLVCLGKVLALLPMVFMLNIQSIEFAVQSVNFCIRLVNDPIKVHG